MKFSTVAILLSLAVTSPVAAQTAVDRWGLSARDWRALSGPVFREKLRAKDRRLEIEVAARSGDVAAMTIAGGALADTIWGDPDYNAARSYLEAAATRGSPRAFTGLGTLYLNGNGVPRDESAALSWFRRAAEAGQVQGMTNLGSMLERGAGAVKDEIAAIRWYQLAAELDDPAALYLLASAYWNGMGTMKNPRLAFTTMERAAEVGQPEAMGWYGVWLDTPEVSAQTADPVAATEWIGRAAQAGSTEFVRTYALRLKSGRGATANPREAAAWLRRGSLAGDPLASFELAHMLADPNSGIEQDRVRAAKLYQSVAEDGRSSAEAVQKAWYNLGLLAQQDGDFALAESQFTRAGAAGHDDAATALAQMTAARTKAAQDRAAADREQALQQAQAARAQAAELAASKVGPSDADIRTFFASTAASMSQNLRVASDGALVVMNTFGSEIFRANISVHDRRCRALPKAQFSCTYRIRPDLSAGADGSWSAALTGLSNSLYDAMLGEGASLKGKAAKLNRLLARDELARTDVFGKVKGQFESRSLREAIWDETLICLGTCDPRL